MRQILIVDDEPDICDCLEAFFRSRGFSVISAYSGEEALECLADSPADVVLLDILLPGISGLEVLKRIRSRYPGVRVVMVTALDSQDLRASAWRFGAIGFVSKPFSFSDATWSPVFTGHS